MKHVFIMAIVLIAFPQAVLAQGRTDPVTVDIQEKSVAWGPCPAIFAPDCRIAVLHSDPAQPNADVLLRIPAGTTLAAHSHTSAERMILVRGELAVRYKGRAASTLKPGNYAFGPAGMPHEAICKSATPCDLFIAFEGPVDATGFSGSFD
ncbi:MAG: cupin domain-containing protein [Polymorphobacter sp.]